jgi:5'-deoxynucleotidase YfbR-like HD superfamily hydrolase
MFTRKIHAAFDYAAECHANQVRKGTQIPYLSHVMAVASLVMEAAADGESEVSEGIEDLVVAGLLHDAVEECGGAPVLEDIRRRFGDRVADIVAHCTDHVPAIGEPRAPWLERKRAYLAQLEQTDDYEALLVSAADKLHNTRAILTDLRTYEREGRPQEAFWQRFVVEDAELKLRVAEILWYYQSLSHVISSRAADEAENTTVRRLARLAGDLESAVGAMVGFAERAGFVVKAPT